MIFKKATRVENGVKEYKVRMFGSDVWLDEKEFKRQVTNGNVFYKANKIMEAKDLVRF
jgi:hypothetical protein